MSHKLRIYSPSPSVGRTTPVDDRGNALHSIRCRDPLIAVVLAQTWRTSCLRVGLGSATVDLPRLGRHQPGRGFRHGRPPHMRVRGCLAAVSRQQLAASVTVAGCCMAERASGL